MPMPQNTIAARIARNTRNEVTVPLLVESVENRSITLARLLSLGMVAIFVNFNAAMPAFRPGRIVPPGRWLGG